MSNLTKNIIWAIITLIIISLIFSYFVQPTKQPTTLNLDQLVADINNNQIKQIKVNGNELDITMADGSAAIAQKESGVSITDTLKNLGVNQSAMQNVNLEVVNQSGWTYWASILIDPLLTLLIIGFFFWFMFRQAKSGVNQAFNFGRSNLKLSNIKDNPPPVLGQMFGRGGAPRTRDAFMQAKRAAPAILFIDEIDAVGRQRGAGMGGGSDEREQTLNQILVEMDGFDRDTRVIVLAATNRPDILDPALLRPGRFDRRVILDLPDMNDREAILKIHAEGKTLEKNVDLRRVAARTPGFSGADLANLMNEAAIASARHNKKSIGQPELLEAAEKVIMGPERKSRVISQKEKEITAYHEGGHALVAASVKDADPVQKVSIISRGFAGGYTMKLPNEDQHLKTRAQFMADLAMMMGGHVSEKLTFGDVSTGASSDLKEASELARRMVTRYGMSELGPIVFGKSEQMMFLGQEISNDKNYSERVASEIDEQIRKLLIHAQDVAEKILKTHKVALKKIADTLMEKEVLEQDDFNALLKPFKIKPITA